MIEVKWKRRIKGTGWKRRKKKKKKRRKLDEDEKE